MFGSLLKQFGSPSALKQAGVLGMNKRNCDYILAYNKRRYYPMVDDKLITKKLAIEYGVPTAGLIGAIRYQYEVEKFQELVAAHESFVIKPGHGSGGRGILVIHGHDGEKFRKADGTFVDADHIYTHITDILSGLFSLGGQIDYALLEECISFSKIFADFSYQGVPDIRVIVFKGYPVMAMMRLATRQSDGRANLHQGAVGVGLSIRTGIPRKAVLHDTPVTHHPDTGRNLSELVVPDWDRHLELAAKCAEMIRLGYFGADIVNDSRLGPLLLELNARPGLGIQIANHAGLRSRLELIESLPPTAHPSREEKIAFAREHFD